jgi:hypothetical protein
MSIRKWHFKVFILFLVLFALFLVTFKISLAELPLGMPKANTEVSGLVPFELVKKIAIKKAEEKWGSGALGPALACCDDDGDIVAYMFPFSIGTTSFPTGPEILSSVRYWRKVAEQGFGAMTEIDKQSVLDNVRNNAKEQMIKPEANIPLTGRTESPQDQIILANKAAKKLGRERMIGARQYGTVVVSARYDRFPIPLYMHYLPPYFYLGDLAIKEATNALSTESVIIERIYFLGRSRGQYFEFSAKGRNILMQSYSLEVVPHEKVLTQKGKRGIPEQEVFSSITEEWIKIRKEVE